MIHDWLANYTYTHVNKFILPKDCRIAQGPVTDWHVKYSAYYCRVYLYRKLSNERTFFSCNFPWIILMQNINFGYCSTSVLVRIFLLYIYVTSKKDFGMPFHWNSKPTCNLRKTNCMSYVAYILNICQYYMWNLYICTDRTYCRSILHLQYPELLPCCHQAVQSIHTAATKT